MKRLLWIIPALIIGGFLLIQLVPYGHNHINPAIIQEPAWDNTMTRDLAVRACFDCHSNETVWPWYSNIAPVSWLVQHDVEEGRSKVNFSEWTEGSRQLRRVDEIFEVIEEGEMPPAIYFPMHPEARLTPTEKQQLIEGFKQTFK